ncbi:MAG: alpha-amylase family glycosyl hydrolase, partial [Eubacteriales bacterium]|nr:alpha-amylase family glycosyl hydrolase [Eubacteriales bacterium]
MKPTFDISPAHAVSPCVRPDGSGVVFSAVLRHSVDNGLQLIHVPDGETVFIPFTDCHRVGSVYSVRLAPFEDGEWLYRYRSGSKWILDPHSTAIVKTVIRESKDAENTKTEGEKASEEIEACSCAPLRADALFPGAPETPLPPADWNRQVLYGVHVKGFTAAMPEDFKGRGTFSGVSARIPYLQELGITAVELMPVYTPLPDSRKDKPFKTMQEALSAWPVGPQGDPMRDMKERPNYWGFGRGLYYALRAEYGTQAGFAQMVRDFHRAGMRVVLQLYFEKGFQLPDQIELLRYYVTRFGIDGFRLMGYIPSPAALACVPSLTDTAFFFDSFPFEELDPEETETGTIITCGGDYQSLLRRFIKSDDYVMKDFLKMFLSVPKGHGALRCAAGYEGFTLADLVSYNERHNEANGEFGLDGHAENYSWNCGAEGETEDDSILTLRRKQIRNILTLLMLSQGTPLLSQGDERMNSQGGNNNPYCQDNEISWVDWTETPEKKQLTAFFARLAAFRRAHPVFCSDRPFQYIDTLGIGHPDVSLHGAEAWKPDLGPCSHSIGIAFCENYAETDPGKRKQTAFTYLAINMYWKELPLALPKLPPYYVWKVVFDTETEEGFLDTPVAPLDQHIVDVPPRSIRLLHAVPDPGNVERERLKKLLEEAAIAAAAEAAAAEAETVEAETTKA